MANVNLNPLQGRDTGASAPATPAAGARDTGNPRSSDGRFAATLAQLATAAQPVTVKRGDTLIGIVKTQARAQGQAVSDNQAFRQAMAVARQNGIANPDRILPGQRIELAGSPAAATSNAAAAVAALANAALANVTTAHGPLALRTVNSLAALPPAATPPVLPAARGMNVAAAFPVLDKTLDRAVERAYLKPAERPAVEQRILGMAQRYGFSPDDFARLALMESGMNPQASNGSCHGIIQFCDGPQRGAAAVGYGQNPQAILGMGLLQQLDLVDRYFEHVGLQNFGPKVGLDDLYLTVLSPAARNERRRDVPLNIGGPQASVLHVDQNTRGPITRNSIIQGLNDVANGLLAPLRTSARSAVRLYADASPPR